jgi:hypothetical protein
MEYTEKIHNKLLSVESRIKNKGTLEREMENMASNFKEKGKIPYDFIVMSLITSVSLIASIVFLFQRNFEMAGFSIFFSAVVGSLISICVASYYLLPEKRFASVTEKIFGEDVWFFFFLFPLKENFITGRLEMFRREINEAKIPFSIKDKALYERMKYFVEHEYPLLKKEKIEAKNEWLETGMKNYRNYVAEYSGKNLEMLELEKGTRDDKKK